MYMLRRWLGLALLVMSGIGWDRTNERRCGVGVCHFPAGLSLTPLSRCRTRPGVRLWYINRSRSSFHDMTKTVSYSTGRHDRAATKQTQESCCHSSRLGRSFSVSRSPRRYAKWFRHGKNTAKALLEMRNRIYECYLVSSSNSLSLTHVCTQIRSEFRPLYLGDEYDVSISKVDRLVQAFFPLMQELKAPIKLAINIKRGRGTNPVQFLSFLRSIVSRKQIKVQFYCKGPGKTLAHFPTRRWVSEGSNGRH